MPDKVDTMAYAGATPWHGLGEKVPADATVAQMRKAAGLTWEPVTLEQTFTLDGKRYTSPDKVLVRDDNAYVLDTVGPRYVPIRNVEVLEFFREYAEAGDLALHTAGSLDHGRYVWALAKMRETFALDARDRTEGYVLLANAHRYGQGATAKFTAVEVVCWNTYQAALAGGSAGVKIWHTRAFNAARRAEVQAEMGLARDLMATFRATATALAETKLTDKAVRSLTAAIFRRKLADDPTEDPVIVRRVVTLYTGEAKGAALLTQAGTAWGLFNAVTQYVDWEHGRTADTRLRSAWFGGNSGVKRRALNLLNAYAERKTP